PIPRGARRGRRDDRGRRPRAPRRPRLALRRSTGPLLRGLHPGLLRGHGGPGRVPDPPGPRGRAGRPRREAGVMSAAAGVDSVPIPASHVELLTRPICAVLTTLCADGTPHSSLVWTDLD